MEMKVQDEQKVDQDPGEFWRMAYGNGRMEQIDVETWITSLTETPVKEGRKNIKSDKVRKGSGTRAEKGSGRDRSGDVKRLKRGCTL